MVDPWEQLKQRFNNQPVRIWIKTLTGPTAEGGMAVFMGRVTFVPGYAILNAGHVHEVWIREKDISVMGGGLPSDDEDDDEDEEIRKLQDWWNQQK